MFTLRPIGYQKCHHDGQSVGFNGISFLLTENIIFEIFGFYTRLNYAFTYFHTSIDVKHYIVYIMHLKSYDYYYLHK